MPRDAVYGLSLHKFSGPPYTSSGASARTWDKTSATTLYAKWTAKTYTVNFDQQSGSGGTSSVTATYGSAMPSITVPTRTGYTFGGYYTSTNGIGTQYYTSGWPAEFMQNFQKTPCQPAC